MFRPGPRPSQDVQGTQGASCVVMKPTGQDTVGGSMITNIVMVQISNPIALEYSVVYLESTSTYITSLFRPMQYQISRLKLNLQPGCNPAISP